LHDAVSLGNFTLLRAHGNDGLLTVPLQSVDLAVESARCPLWTYALLTLEEALHARVGFVSVGLPAAAVGVVVVVGRNRISSSRPG
jgi:hypothetical protein